LGISPPPQAAADFAVEGALRDDPEAKPE